MGDKDQIFPYNWIEFGVETIFTQKLPVIFSSNRETASSIELKNRKPEIVFSHKTYSNNLSNNILLDLKTQCWFGVKDVKPDMKHAIFESETNVNEIWDFASDLFCIYGGLVITNSPQTRLSKRFVKRIPPFGVKTAECGQVNNDWTVSDTQTVFKQQRLALEIKDILQLSERQHHADSQTQNHSRPSTPRPTKWDLDQ